MVRLEYERFADIYGIWTSTAASAQANQAFYVDAYLATDGPVVELGVGDGRLAVEAARRGCPIVGVDLSPAMLKLCRARAERAGVIDRLTLLQADFRAFTLAEPAALIALPYHSLGHLLTLDAKREAIRHVHAQLRPGGRFVFDDFVVTPSGSTACGRCSFAPRIARPAAAKPCSGSPRSSTNRRGRCAS